MTWARSFPRLPLALLAAAWCVLFSTPVAGAGTAEDRAFTNALKAVAGNWWELADRELAAFLQQHPTSERRAEAVLLQAQTRCQTRQPAGAIELLSTNLAAAGALADEYQFWIGEAELLASNYVAAARAYARVTQQFPSSARRADAVFGEARAFARLGDWPRVTALLGVSDGAFQPAARAQPDSSLALDGWLLLAEAQVGQRQFAAARTTLELLAAPSLAPRRAWLRQFLRCRVDVGEGNITTALAGASNLVSLAASAARRDLISESYDFTAGLLAELNRNPEAIAMLEQNLVTNAPPAVRRAALFRIVKLLGDAGQLDAAGQRLDAFLSQNPEASATPAVVLASGELNLRRHLAASVTNATASARSNGVAATNLLPNALAQFDAVLTNQAAGALRGQAQLLRGWALWLAGRSAESGGAFAAAALALPVSEDQAVARFKVADAAFQQRDFQAAVTNYAAVVNGYTGMSAVTLRLVEPALYQLLRASLAADDGEAAAQALHRLVTDYPASAVTQSGMLLMGERAVQDQEPDSARKLFSDFLFKYPDSELAPQAQLAVARTWEQARKWDEAISAYEAWAARFPTNALLPTAEYGRAWNHYQAGRDTNALTLFTNLVARFTNSHAAALAQYWIGDYNFRRGDYTGAESDYQVLFKTWPGTELARQAQMMAGRAAMARLGFGEALDYFTMILNDSNSPPALVAEAFFAYGDATAQRESADTNAPLANVTKAISAFLKFQQPPYQTNPLAVLAQGRIGDCFLQLATADPNQYTNAAQAYQKVMADPRASVAARSQAEVGLGLVLDKQAQVKQTSTESTAARQAALGHFLQVADEKNLHEGETAEPYWVKRAAFEAGRLAEDLQLWEQAALLYERLSHRLPALKPALETRLNKARQQAATVPR
jgi:TolA-binding protein